MILLQVIIFSLSFFCFYKKYNTYGNYVFFEYKLILLFMSTLYLLIPSFFFELGGLFEGGNPLSLGFNNDVHSNVTNTSIIFHLTILFFCLLCKPENINVDLKYKLARGQIKFFKFLSLSFMIIGGIVFLYAKITIPQGLPRVQAFPIVSSFIAQFKVGYLFYFSIVYGGLLSILTKNKKWVFTAMPFFLVEVLGGGRIYLMQFVVFFFLIFCVIEKNKPLLKNASVLVLTILIFGLLRGLMNDFDNAYSVLVYIFGEFVNTRTAALISFSSYYEYNLNEYFLYSFSRILPSIFSDAMLDVNFDGVVSVVDNMKYKFFGDTTLGYGGSILSDIYFINNKYYYFTCFFYALSICFWGSILTYILKFNSLSGTFLYLFSVANVFVIFRYGFTPNFLSSIASIIFYGFPIILIDLYQKKIR